MIKKTLAMLIPLLVFLTHTTGFCFAKFGVVSHSPSLLETGNSQLETDNKDWLGNQWTFTYDAAGRLTGMSSPKVAQTFLSAFSYDNAGRLSSWSVDGIAGRTITYDAANRRIRDDITAGAIPKPTLQRTALNTFDVADKLVSSSVRYGQGADSTSHITETFTYDNNGALTEWQGSPLWKGGGGNAAGGLSLTYDALGQVAKVAQTFLSAFSYDALGNRVVADTKLWIPNHSDALKRPLMECDTSGNVLRYYIWGDNRLLGFIEGNTLTVAHSDERGSVIALTDLSGNIFYIANYGPHGEDWESVGVNPTPFTWLGGYGVQTLETDTPLKLYLTRHRVYSATLNRFLSSDPIGLAGGNNLYAYGEGNPMAYIDPLGLCSQSSGWEYAWEMTTAIASGFWEGWTAGWEINFNTLSLGLTDSRGWTESWRHEGFEYDVSRGLAAVGTIALAQAGALAVTEVAGTALVNWGAGAAGVAATTAAPTATKVIGRLPDTAVARNWAGHDVLNLSKWSIEANMQWIDQGIANRQVFYTASPMTPNNMVHSAGELAGKATVYAQEIQRLLSAGYRQVGDYLLPPLQ